MLDIAQFRQFNQAENHVVTMHGRRRMFERGILLRDVIHAVANGEIIERYPASFSQLPDSWHHNCRRVSSCGGQSG